MRSIGGACIGFVVLQILSRRNLLHKGGIMKLHTALTIAGTDPSGGAGIMADLKSFKAEMYMAWPLLLLWWLKIQRGCTT